jgi:hypothetical protein
MDRQRVADAKAAHIDRPRHLSLDLVWIYFKPDVPRPQVFSALP